MTKRGQIMKDATSGPGIVVVDGFQYRFQPERVWQAPGSPTVGMIVDVTFHPDYGIQYIRAAVVEALALAQYAPPPPVYPVSPYNDPQLAPLSLPVSLTPVQPAQASLKFDVPVFIAVVLLAIGWYLLPTLRIGFSGFGIDITFAKLIATMGSVSSFYTGNSSANSLYSALVVVALAAPFLPYLWRNRYAALAGCIPLALMTASALIAMNNVNHVSHSANLTIGSFFGDQAGDLASSFVGKMVHIEIGAWLSALAGVFLAFDALRKAFTRAAKH